MDSPPNYPDGLTRTVIDALVTEVAAVTRPDRRMPSLFADRDAALRHERRRANRASARMARSSPPVMPVAADGEEVA
ncbi:MAG: hypothetical protein JO063_07810 [Pseudonocardiales bacterium]|nr:hypothetical protein [Pseudonocardiales bacterium]MBV9028698.1 hypothetical protein [Pseudonocardiales bacterium]MBW0010007.1 hypothetical protein [Pseudonocardiales bacterium]